MNTELNITTERIDDFVLLLQVMMRLNLPAILDRHLPRHWLQQGLSWGWVATIWLAHIISQRDHRKLSVRDWVRQAHTTLEKVTGLNIRDTDFTDDRLTLVLRELSRPEYWHAIERDLGQNTIRAYDLEQDTVRVDATTVSGYHTVGAAGLFQFGKSKDNPDLPQIKVMQGTLDPLGLPVATDVVSGEQADDGLYIPIVERMLTILTKAGGLFVGDCKMSALATRAYIHAHAHYYLSPLALVGDTATEVQNWIQAALDGERTLTDIEVLDDQDCPILLGRGYETSRVCSAQAEGETITWTERVFVVHSQSYAQALERGLEQRLATATAKLQALTPPRRRGKRQITEEAQLIRAAEAILQAHRGEGLLTYTFERQEEQVVKFVGRGRGTADRPKRVTERVRYQITSINRQEADITALKKTFGWRAYATNAPAEKLTLETAVLTYRDEWLVERGFHRLKGVPLSLDPLFVKRDDQVVGLTHLLTIAVRLLTLIEFVVRRALKQAAATLVGLHKENPKKATATPTTERLLQAFSNITLTIIHFPDRILPSNSRRSSRV
ncbi:MAG: IS1634 family transposase [Anaerolineales bacterium]|nr:IS1634 family transposase [Anaerolineales bacterium]